MYQIQPFPGLTYNSKKVGSLSNVVAPPYDVISPEEQDILYKKHPQNIVRLILNKEKAHDDRKDNKYLRANAFLNKWRKSGHLQQDEVSSLYFYVQNYTLPNGESFQREGFLGLLELSPFEKKKVIPHEYTHSKPRKEQKRLIITSKSHLSPIFVLYADPKGIIEKSCEVLLKTRPYLNVLDKARVRHRAWKISDPGHIRLIQNALKSKTFIIADGHHRYNAALEARKSIRGKQKRQASPGQPYDYTMSYFCNLRNPGLSILPTHRIVHSLSRFSREELVEKLKEYFSISEVKFNKSKPAPGIRLIQEKMKSKSAGTASSFGLYFPNESVFLLLKGRRKAIQTALERIGVPKGVRNLDVITLHQLIMEEILGISQAAQEKKTNIRYVSGVTNLSPVLKEDDFQACFLMNPVSFSDLQSVVKTGLCLPQKATFFYPKILSGVVIHAFD